MKCPKCGYISFDYNQSCPKCNEDMSAERAKLNLSDYRSDPPFLLGALTGELNEPEIELQMDHYAGMELPDDQMDRSLVNSVGTATDETVLDKLDNAEKITVVIDKKKGRVWAEA